MDLTFGLKEKLKIYYQKVIPIQASPNGKFTKEEDIMDVWFDSGSSHTAVLIERGLPYPADLSFRRI